MDTKKAREFLKANTKIDIAAMILAGLVLIWINTVSGIVCLVIALGLSLYHGYVSSKKTEKLLEDYKQEIITSRRDLFDAFAAGSPFMLCFADREMNLRWYNQSFEKEILSAVDPKDLLGTEALNKLFSPEPEKIKVRISGRSFEVFTQMYSEDTPNLRLFFFRDISQEEMLVKKYNDSIVCLAFVNIDNMDQILSDAPIEGRSMISAQLEEVIYNWSKEIDGSVLKMTDSRFAVLFKNEHLNELKRKEFPVLNAVRKIETASDFPASFSIGLGCGECSFDELVKNAAEALELALGRGGDQVVVRDNLGENEFFGGILPTVEKRNKGKSRVMAHAVLGLLGDAQRVLIMGHARPDMDSFGAALGMYALADNCGKEVHIVLENPGDGIELLYNAAVSGGEDRREYSIIDHESAEKMITGKTLLVLVDHHRAALSEYAPLIPKADRIAIIDHHRKAPDAVEKPLLSFIESYASSASEIVTELLQYCGERGEIMRFEAEALLAGITLDTKNFTTNAGVRTFEAASWLKRSGADNNTIRNYFKVDLESFQKKINVIANAEIIGNGIAVAYTKDVDPSMQVIVSQAADELLSMRGVDAAIAAGRTSDFTTVSARSNGKYNMQALMEKLGGGGHQQAAAVQLSEGPEEAISIVVSTLRSEGLL